MPATIARLFLSQTVWLSTLPLQHFSCRPLGVSLVLCFETLLFTVLQILYLISHVGQNPPQAYVVSYLVHSLELSPKETTSSSENPDRALLQ